VAVAVVEKPVTAARKASTWFAAQGVTELGETVSTSQVNVAETGNAYVELELHGHGKHGFGLHVVPTPLNTGSGRIPVVLTQAPTPPPVFAFPETPETASHDLPQNHVPPLAVHSALLSCLQAGYVWPDITTASGPQHDPLWQTHWHCGLTVHVVPSQHAPSLQACRQSASVA
jgi:hypothetical protein